MLDLFGNQLRKALDTLTLEQLEAAARRALADPRVEHAPTPRLRKHLLLLRLAMEVSSTLPFPMRSMVQSMISQLPKVLKDSDPQELRVVGALLRDIGDVLAQTELHALD